MCGGRSQPACHRGAAPEQRAPSMPPEEPQGRRPDRKRKREASGRRAAVQEGQVLKPFIPAERGAASSLLADGLAIKAFSFLKASALVLAPARSRLAGGGGLLCLHGGQDLDGGQEVAPGQEGPDGHGGPPGLPACRAVSVGHPPGGGGRGLRLRDTP